MREEGKIRGNAFPQGPSPETFSSAQVAVVSQSQFYAKKAFISRIMSMMPTWKGQFFSQTPQ